MLSERINNALNTQINKEFFSAYLYLSMSNYFNGLGLEGFGHWCKKQAEEEVSHGMDIFNFLTDLNGKIEFTQITTPESNFRNPIDTIKEIVSHEKYITETIKSITIMAKEENAFTTQNFLECMLQEQIEEEKTSYKIYTQLKLFGESKTAMYLLDKELAQRK